MMVTTPKKQILVDSRRMAYVECGQGIPLLFLHGNQHRPICGVMSCGPSTEPAASSRRT
jgi:hypothetical protein